MAEINFSQSTKRFASVQRSKRLSTRVDLTPMVDLGFLLITFFIFSTTMAESKTMNLVMPDDSNVANPNLHPADRTITITLFAGDSLAYSIGTNHQGTGFPHLNDIRKVIIEHKEYLRNRYGNDSGLLVLIKPTEESTFKNLVDVLDEMLINEIGRYMILPE